MAESGRIYLYAGPVYYPAVEAGRHLADGRVVAHGAVSGIRGLAELGERVAGGRWGTVRIERPGSTPIHVRRSRQHFEVVDLESEQPRFRSGSARAVAAWLSRTLH